MSLKKIVIYKGIIVCLLLAIFLLPNQIYGIDEKEANVKNIVILDSYSSANPWSKNLVQAFVEHLEAISGTTINVRIEYLNSIDHNTAEYHLSFVHMLNSKYKNFNTDLILTIGSNALESIRQEVLNPQSLFYHVPIVFSGNSRYIELDEEEMKYIFGSLQDLYWSKMIHLVLELHTEIDKIKVISLNTDLEKVPKSKGRQELIEKLFLEQADVEFINTNYIEDILENLTRETDSNYAIIIGNMYFSNHTKRLVSAEKVIQQIRQITDAAIYTYDEAYINVGAIGGIISNSRKNGIVTAELVNKVLLDEESPAIQVIPSEYEFDYKEIYKNDINISKIPRQSIITNKSRFQLLLPKGIKLIVQIGIISLELIGCYMIFYIYRQKQTAKKNKRLYDEAKLHAQIRGDFITSMSHDLKAPINIIRSSVQLIHSLEDNVEPEYLSQRLTVITQNANRLLRLVNNLIDMMKLEENNFNKMKLENVNLVEVVEEICLGSVDYMKQRELEFIFDTEEEEIITAIDREKIERVILNLLSNAIKFTPPLGLITVNMAIKDGDIKIVIKDSGLGIASDKLEAIFLKFYQIDNTLTKPGEGTGIGLYIVKKLIELHEGKITVESREGIGTSFTIRLPIKPLALEGTKECEIKHTSGQLLEVELSDL